VELLMQALKDNVKAKHELIMEQSAEIVKLQYILRQALPVLKGTRSILSKDIVRQIQYYLDKIDS
jgi:hypothetical protein